MGCTKRVSWHQRSLPCVRQKNIRTLDATPNTHAHTHTYNQTQASAVRCSCSYPQTTFVRPSPSRKQKDAESEQHTHTVHATFCYRKISLREERYLLHLRQKTRRGCPLHTHTVNDISATARNTLDCLTISFAHIHTFLTSH